MRYTFSLQYEPDCIPKLADQYMNGPAIKGRTGAQADGEMESAGRRILSGNFSVSDAETIYKWKSPRSYFHFEGNKPAEVKAALTCAVNAIKANPDDPTDAIHSLRKLKGVGVKVATAFLTALDPQEYTVLDFRALEALGAKDGNTVELYVCYRNACKKLAEQHGVSLRTFDRANWQWSKNKSKGKGCP